jgi:hypothetical protein
VLAELDPPLNLAKMPKTAIRTRLTELRRPHSKKRSASTRADPEDRSPGEPAPAEPDALAAKVDSVREDEAFLGLLGELAERDRAILDRLAE